MDKSSYTALQSIYILLCKLVFLHDNFDLITTSKSAEAELGRVDQTLAADPGDPDPVAGPSWR